MRINHNMSAINTHRQLTDNNTTMYKSVEKLSSGLRINRAGDDAAGLAISEKMRGQIRGLDQASRNAQDGISLIQTAEAALSTTHNILGRMRELAVQASNDSYTDSDRQQLQKEVQQLKAEIDRVAYTTEYNTKKLLNGSLTAAKELQGTKAVSNVVAAADLMGLAGKAIGGSAITERGSLQTITGYGYSETAFNALDEKIAIVAGVNDNFSFNINGTTTVSGAFLAASTGSGYTQDQFANAVEEAINSSLKASGFFVEKNQVQVSVEDGKLKVTTKEAGDQTQFSFGSGAYNRSALSAMGFRGYQDKIAGALDMSNGINITNGAASGQFVVNLGSGSATVTLNNNTSYTLITLKSEIQNQLDSAFGGGVVKVDDRAGKLGLTSTVKTNSFNVTLSAGLSNLFGLAASTSGGIIHSGSTITANGVNSIMGFAKGINIAYGVNDQFRLAVDGGEQRTITLSSKLYATKSDLVNEINNQIGSDAVVTGKVQARLTVDNKIEFESVTTGSASSVAVLAPDASDQSALGVLGFSAVVGGILGANDIAAGINISGVANNPDQYKLTVVLGNRSAMINLLDQPNIERATNIGSGLTTRDAVVKGLQAELDKAFGIGALQVVLHVSGAIETLLLNTLTATSKFSISSITGASGVSTMFDSSVAAGGTLKAILGTTPTNVRTTGIDAQNRSLAGNTLLLDLTDRDHNNLGLTVGNIIAFNGTQDGKGFSTSVEVKQDTTVGDLMALMRSVEAFNGASVGLDLMKGTISIEGKKGARYDLSNLSLSAQQSFTDSTPVGGFNRPLGQFHIVRQAQDSSRDSSVLVQVGANQWITDSIDVNSADTGSLRLTNIDISTSSQARWATSVIDNAMDRISDERAKLGAIQNRLENTIYDLSIFSENLTASESRIRDVDIARETMSYAKSSILSNGAGTILAKANLQSMQVLLLIR
ncbi:flagellin [Paenibacillus radicis (ex Xue et al. 2023)]